jgi:hypothetical protein
MNLDEVNLLESLVNFQKRLALSLSDGDSN